MELPCPFNIFIKSVVIYDSACQADNKMQM